MVEQIFKSNRQNSPRIDSEKARIRRSEPSPVHIVFIYIRQEPALAADGQPNWHQTVPASGRS